MGMLVHEHKAQKTKRLWERSAFSSPLMAPPRPGRVDCFLPNDTFVHDGLRLLDGNDVGRAIFAVDEESMSDGIEA